MSAEPLIELRARTQGAKQALVELCAAAKGEQCARLSHKIEGVKLVLGYIDDAIRDAKKAEGGVMQR